MKISEANQKRIAKIFADSSDDEETKNAFGFMAKSTNTVNDKLDKFDKSIGLNATKQNIVPKIGSASN